MLLDFLTSAKEARRQRRNAFRLRGKKMSNLVTV